VNPSTKSPQKPEGAGRKRSGSFLRKFFDISDRSYWDMLSNAGTVGLHMVSCTVIGLAMGWYLDKWLDTRPWLTMTFLLFGIAAGFRNVYRETRRLQRTHFDESVYSEDSGKAPGERGSERKNDK
jgi:ATP synthase protein I